MRSISAPPTGASRTDPILVEFSQPVAASSLVEDTVVVVEGETSSAFLSDLNNPPLSTSRQAKRIPAIIDLSSDALEVRWVPARPMEPNTRHTFLVSRAVTDSENRELVESFSYQLTTGGVAAGAPDLRMLAPAELTEEVPQNVARVIVAFSEEVFGVSGDSLSVENTPTHVEVATQWCDTCYAIVIDNWLEANRLYPVTVSPQIVDADGEAVFVSEAPMFRVGPRPDTDPPILGAAELSTSDGCLTARWLSDEPATSRAFDVFTPGFSLIHQVGLVLDAGLYSVSLQSSDWANNLATLGPYGVESSAGSTLQITEVMANPAGPEPAQEWIEVVNLGSEEVSTEGWTLADPSGSDILPSTILPPNAVALIVAATFDLLEGSDNPPHPAAAILRLENSIGQGGMRNSGEPVYLIDPAGNRVSSYGGYVDMGSDPGRSVMRTGQCDLPTAWAISPESGPTPGVQ